MGRTPDLKDRVGYMGAKERPGCANCKNGDERHADRSPPWNKAYWVCKQHRFGVTAMAICNDHAPKGQPAAAGTQQ